MPPRVLVVDDSASARDWLQRELTALGAVVDAATDGEEGLRRALSGDFDLVVTDVMMPRLDGFQLCERLREAPRTASLPVVILSAEEDDASVERGFAAGAAAYLRKGMSGDELRRGLRETLERTRLLSGRSVLVVEDSAAIRTAVADRFRAAGYLVHTANNGREALAGLRQGWQPDVVISDLMMPEMGGLALCEALQADERWRDVPFVAMSVAGDRPTLRDAIQRGAAAYLVKPFNLEQLLVTVERLLTDRARRVLADLERLEAERNLTLASIASLVQALEARDHYTRGHSDSVAAIVLGMAPHLGLPPADMDALALAGRLHDIGKIGTPDAVLLKPGRLDDAEMAIVRRHPETGFEILRPIPSLGRVCEAILAHHERFDGKGYPRGLAGENIPLWGRVIAVADTFDALTSDRPYRRRHSREEALGVIRSVNGTQLCPRCCAAFFAWLEGQAGGGRRAGVRRGAARGSGRSAPAGPSVGTA